MTLIDLVRSPYVSGKQLQAKNLKLKRNLPESHSEKRIKHYNMLRFPNMLESFIKMLLKPIH